MGKTLCSIVEEKVNRFRLFCKRHLSEIVDRHGEYRADEYAEAVNTRFDSILWIIGMSFLSIVILMFDIRKLSEETLSSFLVLEIALMIYGIVHLFCMRRIPDESGFDPELVRMWTMISFITAMSGIAVGSFGLYRMTSIFDISIGPEKEEIVVFENLGIEITIPKEWSSIEWEYKSDDSSYRPRYFFNTHDNGCRLWFDLYGFSTSAHASSEDLRKEFVAVSKMKFDAGVIEAPSIKEIAGRKVWKASGRDKRYPELIFVRYQLAHCGTMIIYTYRFKDQHDYDEEVKRAEDILADIKFTEVQKPVRKPIEDKRPDDYVIDENSVNITSARIKFNFPDNCSGVEWLEKTRRAYTFDLLCGSYKINADLLVVYTSETADISEIIETSREKVTVYFDSEYKIEPTVLKLNNVSAVYAAGYRRGDESGVLVLRYVVIHKGALLCINTEIPESMNLESVHKDVEQFIRNIEFY